MEMKKMSKRRVDMYELENGLTLMNVIDKNENGKIHSVTTYIGIDGGGFFNVENAHDLDAFGSRFSYSAFVRMQHDYLPTLVDVFERNTGIKWNKPEHS